MAEQIALSHHERWDGTGYPQGRVGDAIPWVARIVSVADVFDALSHYRPYRPAWPLPSVIHEIEQIAGSQLDREMTTAFLTSCVQGFIERPAPPSMKCKRHPEIFVLSRRRRVAFLATGHGYQAARPRAQEKIAWRYVVLGRRRGAAIDAK